MFKEKKYQIIELVTRFKNNTYIVTKIFTGVLFSFSSKTFTQKSLGIFSFRPLCLLHICIHIYVIQIQYYDMFHLVILFGISHNL